FSPATSMATPSPETSAWTRRRTRLGWRRRGGPCRTSAPRSTGHTSAERAIARGGGDHKEAGMRHSLRHSWTFPAAAIAIAAGLAIGFSAPSIEAQAKNVLVAKKVAAEPALDGTLDAGWNSAQPLTAKAIGGKNVPGGCTGGRRRGC